MPRYWAAHQCARPHIPLVITVILAITWEHNSTQVSPAFCASDSYFEPCWAFLVLSAMPAGAHSALAYGQPRGARALQPSANARWALMGIEDLETLPPFVP